MSLFCFPVHRRWFSGLSFISLTMALTVIQIILIANVSAGLFLLVFGLVFAQVALFPVCFINFHCLCVISLGIVCVTLQSEMNVSFFKDVLHFLLLGTWDTIFRKHLYVFMGEFPRPTQVASTRGVHLFKDQSVTTPTLTHALLSFLPALSVPRHLTLQFLEHDRSWVAGFSSRLLFLQGIAIRTPTQCIRLLTWVDLSLDFCRSGNKSSRMRHQALSTLGAKLSKCSQRKRHNSWINHTTCLYIFNSHNFML